MQLDFSHLSNEGFQKKSACFSLTINFNLGESKSLDGHPNHVSFYIMIIDCCAIFTKRLYIETYFLNHTFDLKTSLKYKKIQYGPWMVVVCVQITFQLIVTRNSFYSSDCFFVQIYFQKYISMKTQTLKSCL